MKLTPSDIDRALGRVASWPSESREAVFHTLRTFFPLVNALRSLLLVSLPGDVSVQAIVSQAHQALALADPGSLTNNDLACLLKRTMIEAANRGKDCTADLVKVLEQCR